MRKFNKFLIIIGISIILLIPTVVYAANYFSSIKQSNDIVNNNTSFVPNYTPISKYEDLVHNSLYDEDLSNSNNHSNPKFLQFTDDIRLFSDLVIYTDVNIDLNEMKLDLNGHNLTFKNSYYTNLIIENGIITNSKTNESKLTFDLPNGIAAYEGVIDPDSTGTINVVVANQDSNMVLNNALNYAVFKLYGYNYGFELYRSNNPTCRTCQFEHNLSETCCVYAISDLEFIDHLYGYNIQYSYESLDTTVLTNKGNLLKSGTVELTITARIGATSSSRTIYVHSLDSNQYNDAGLSLLLQYFEPYYDSENSVYNFSAEVLIPKNIPYLGITLGYTFYDSSKQSIPGIVADSLDDNYYIMTVNSVVNSIEITANKDDTSKSCSINVAGNAVSNIIDKNTIARKLVSKIVGNEIGITKDSSGKNGYTTKTLSTDISSEFSSYVSGISYKLVNNSDNIYNIDSNNILHVNPSGERLLNPEESLTSTAVICTVTFYVDCGLKPDSVNEIQVSVPIKYINNDGEQTGLASFRPYYVQFDKWISLASGGQTINDFTLRGTVGNDYPIINLIPQIYSNEGLLIEGVIKNGGTYPVYSRSNGGTKTYYYLVDNVETIIDDTNSIILVRSIIQFSYIYEGQEIVDKNDVTAEMVASGNLRYKITINKNYVLESVSTVGLYYEYKMNENSDWTTEGDFISYFNLPGIFRFGDNERFKDQTLFDYIKGLPVYGSQTTDYFDTKLLINEATFDVSGKTIESFKGLEAFKNVTSLNASHSGFTTNDIKYVAKMDSLETLNISNNNLKDYSESLMGFPTGTKADFISELASLKYLTTLDVSNNQIYDFSGLVNLPAIKTIYLQKNLFEYTVSFFGFPIDIGAIVNQIYGSKGALNTAVYTQLLAKEVEIYNDVDAGGNPIKFVSEGEVAAIYRNLTNVEYQNKLANGVKIETLFASYCTYENGKYYSNIELFNGGVIQSKRFQSNSGDSTVDGKIQNISSTNKEYEYVEFRCTDSNKTTATQFEVVYHYTIFIMEKGLLTSNYKEVPVDIIIPYQVKRY